jgi:hypothetical protein
MAAVKRYILECVWLLWMFFSVRVAFGVSLKMRNNNR